MQIEVKENEPCKLSVVYTADAEEILNKRGEVLKQFKNAPVPGCRQGKASMDAIKVHYRNQINESLKRALAEDAFHNTLFEKKVKPHGPPQFNSLLLADGKFVCEFEMRTKPDFELQPYKDLEMPNPHQVETETEIFAKLMQELRVRLGEVTPYADTDFVQMGDNVIVDYEGFLGEEKVEQLCATGEMLTVGASNLKIFDDNILGMVMGETREFDVSVPESGMPSIAGKTVRMKVTLNMGSKTVPCPLDDTLAVKVGKATIAELEEQVRGVAASRWQSQKKASVNEAVANKLVESNTISVPPWMSLSEAQYLAHNSKMDWAKISDSDKEFLINMAEKNVKLALILDKIREENPEAQLSDHEVFDILKQNLAKTQVNESIDDVIKRMNQTGYLQVLFSRIRDEYTMDFLTKTVKFTE